MGKKNWGKSYKFGTAQVTEYWYENERRVKFVWEDGLILAWNPDTGKGRIVQYGN